jgi:hypothetical protein
MAAVWNQPEVSCVTVLFTRGNEGADPYRHSNFRGLCGDQNRLESEVSLRPMRPTSARKERMKWPDLVANSVCLECSFHCRALSRESCGVGDGDRARVLRVMIPCARAESVSEQVQQKRAILRRLFLVAILVGITVRARARVTVSQLEKVLAKARAAHNSDADVVRQIGTMELSERLTEATQERLIKNLALDARVAQALHLLADLPISQSSSIRQQASIRP